MVSQPEWISREDAAVLARCSIDTIIRRIKSVGLTTKVGNRGKVLIKVADLVQCGRLIAADGATGPDGGAALTKAEGNLARAQAQIARLEGQLAETKQSSSLALGQLKEKDTQLRTLQQSFDRLIIAVTAKDRS